MIRLTRPSRVRGVGTLLGAAALTLAAPAHATWSIVICDTRTGEVAIASATCLTNFDLQAGTPVMLIGVGGATAQSSVDSNATNRTFIRDGFYDGIAPVDILAGLSTFDSAHQSRQYGMVDVLGRAVTFSGSGAGQWKGGTTGQVGDLVYAVQGNVLWGPLVVDRAVDAIINTPGDVPAKLMAAMEAARVEGGDGRCSCSQGSPSGCSTLPDEFKSAHIAYMLIGRAGDRDGSNGNYKMGNLSTTFTTGEFTGDGRIDVAAVGGGGIGIFPNISQPGREAQVGSVITTAVGFSPRDIAVADFNADGKTDVVVTDNASDSIYVLMGQGNGTFAAPAVYAAGDGAQAVVTGDLNGDTTPDIACSNTTADSISVFLNTGSGAMGAPTTIMPGDGPQLFAPADADGDGDLDLPAGSSTARSLSFYRNNGAGVFTAGPATIFSSSVTSVDVGDINGDSRPDAVVTVGNGSNISILLQNVDGTYQVSTISIGGTAGAAFLRDLDGNGTQDILVSQKGSSRMYVIRGQGNGMFDAAVWYPIGFAPNTTRLADMDGDGDLDPVMRVGSNTLCLMQHVGNGVFNSVSGLGGGDYFMDFNIANQTSGAIDPVFQCQALFDAWRAGLVGVPDAVQSLASFNPTVIHADGSSSTTLTIRGRDWQLADVSLAAASISVNVEGGDLVTTGPAQHNPDGTASVPVTAKTTCGTAVFEVTISGLGRDVVLMPKVALTISDPSDFDLSGFVDTDDFDAFVNAFIAGGDNADFDQSGFVDLDDYIAFVGRFENPC